MAGMEKTQQFLIPISIVVAGALIAVGIFFGGTGPKSDQANLGNDAAPKVNIKDVNIKNDPYIGNPKAKVTIAYWTDYQCPFCKQFEQTALQDIIKNYVATDKVKVVFKDFQFLGPDSLVAGLIARAVWDTQPDKYFAWREEMFNKQDAEHEGFGDEASIIALTRTISGLDADKVVANYTNKKAEYQALLDADRTEAQGFGINGTPGFIIGEQLLSGAMPFSTFQQIIEAEL